MQIRRSQFTSQRNRRDIPEGVTIWKPAWPDAETVTDQCRRESFFDLTSKTQRFQGARPYKQGRPPAGT